MLKIVAGAILGLSLAATAPADVLVADTGHFFDYTPDPAALLISGGSFGWQQSVLLTTDATHFDGNGLFVVGVDYRIDVRQFGKPAFEPDLSGEPAPATPLPSSAWGGIVALSLLGAIWRSHGAKDH